MRGEEASGRDDGVTGGAGRGKGKCVGSRERQPCSRVRVWGMQVWAWRAVGCTLQLKLVRCLGRAHEHRCIELREGLRVLKWECGGREWG